IAAEIDRLLRVDEIQHDVYKIEVGGGETVHIAVPKNWTQEQAQEWYEKDLSVVYGESESAKLITGDELDFHITDDGSHEWKDNRIHLTQYLRDWVTPGYPEFICSSLN